MKSLHTETDLWGVEGCFLLAIICVIVIVIVIVFSLAIIYVIGDKKIDQKKWKVSSVVDTATGEELDFTVDSPSVNGEKMEVFVFMCFFHRPWQCCC